MRVRPLRAGLFDSGVLDALRHVSLLDPAVSARRITCATTIAEALCHIRLTAPLDRPTSPMGAGCSVWRYWGVVTLAVSVRPGQDGEVSLLALVL